MEYKVCCTPCDLDRMVENLDAALDLDEHHQERYGSHFVEVRKVE